MRVKVERERERDMLNYRCKRINRGGFLPLSLTKIPNLETVNYISDKSSDTQSREEFI